MVVLLKEKTLEHLAKKASPPKQDSVVQAQRGPDKDCKSDKANAAKSNTEREEKQPEGCENDAKSRAESEEKPPEGCKKSIPSQWLLSQGQPGTAQLWLASQKTKEEGEKKKKKKSNKMK